MKSPIFSELTIQGMLVPNLAYVPNLTLSVKSGVNHEFESSSPVIFNLTVEYFNFNRQLSYQIKPIPRQNLSSAFQEIYFKTFFFNILLTIVQGVNLHKCSLDEDKKLVKV